MSEPLISLCPRCIAPILFLVPPVSRQESVASVLLHNYKRVHVISTFVLSISNLALPHVINWQTGRKTSVLLEMSLQDLNILMPLGLELQLASSLFTQPSIVLQRNSDERMNSNRWVFPQPPSLSGVNMELLKRNLWQSFHEQNTEMIITKCGRRMFPSVQIKVNGLQKRESYYVLMEITLASNRRHKYCGYESGNKSGNMSGWSYAGPAEPQHPFDRRIYLHPDSPATGEHWLDNPINFNKLKITNNINDHNSNVVLTSMHKYVPKIWIIRCADAKNFNELFSYPAASFVFNVTEFIAVTAYQNNGITKLKIDNNPFAKGFRETGQSKFKRKYQQIDQQARLDFSVDDEDSSSDSESNHVKSERDNVVNNLENLMQESARKFVIKNNAENDARDDIRPIAVNPLVPIAENPRSPSMCDHNEIPFHRPWLDPPSHRSQLRSSVLRNRASHNLNLSSSPSHDLSSRSPSSRSSSSHSLPSYSPLSCSSLSRSSSSRSSSSYSPPTMPPPLSMPTSSSLYIPPLPVYYFPYINSPYNKPQNYTRFHDYQHQFDNSYR